MLFMEGGKADAPAVPTPATADIPDAAVVAAAAFANLDREVAVGVGFSMGGTKRWVRI